MKLDGFVIKPITRGLSNKSEIHRKDAIKSIGGKSSVSYSIEGQTKQLKLSDKVLNCRKEERVVM